VVTDDGARLAAAVRALAKDLDALTHTVESMAGAQQKIADDVAAANRGVVQLSRALAKLGTQPQAPAEEAPPPLPYWLVMTDPEEARGHLADLIDWVAAVYLRFPGTALPACWLWHEWAVAELHTLRLAWFEARDGRRGSAAKLLDWHERGRPGVVGRLAEGLGTCSLAEHVARKPQTWRPPRAPGTDLSWLIAEWWSTTHGDGTPPEPTAAMLAAERDAIKSRTTY
jgi:hypothetical protein